MFILAIGALQNAFGAAANADQGAILSGNVQAAAALGEQKALINAAVKEEFSDKEIQLGWLADARKLAKAAG